MKNPDYIFESSWEVCNKVGGIYTVLSTRAKTLQDVLTDKIFFIGPDFWKDKPNPLFKESKTLLGKWRKHAQTVDGLNIRIGRWQIPGEPIAILVDFIPFFQDKNLYYAQAWEDFQIDSLHAYGDYDEASMFSIASAKVAESFYRFNVKKNENVVYQAHEWMTCLGALYLQKAVPEIATIFTTHATSIGRSIAGNNKPLYDYLDGYNGDQMAQELNMESKHSVEKQTAHHVDCFTTVSDITALECEKLLDRKVDVVLKNGFENDFVPKGAKFTAARKKARTKLLTVAEKMLGEQLPADTLIVSVGGRYEYKNKGIDLFVEALNRYRWSDEKRTVLAFINVPAWMKGPREDVKARMETAEAFDYPCPNPRITHELHEPYSDRVLCQLNWLDIQNRKCDNMKIIFAPCYLNGNDGIFNMTYYDLLIGNDLSVFPSYYEPWGYTPLESVAFHVPCITTDLAGFGLWVNSLKGRYSEISDGVKVIHRSDNNFEEVANTVRDTIIELAHMDAKQFEATRKKAAAIAEKALWKHFITDYWKAYDVALRNAEARNNKKEL